MSVARTERKALPYSNVVANGTATNNITVGKTLNTLQLKLGGTALTKAMITMVRMLANTKTIIEGSATQLDAINAFKGLTTNASFLDLAFEDLTGLDLLDRQIGSLDTANGISLLTTEVTIAGATAPTLAGRLIESAPQNDASGNPTPYSGMVSKILRYPFNVSTGGDLPVNLPFGKERGAIIKRIHVFHGGNMTGALVKGDSITYHESLLAENNYELTRNKRVPQANVYTLDFIKNGSVRDALDTRGLLSLENIYTFSAADSGYVLVEYLDTLNNL